MRFGRAVGLSLTVFGILFLYVMFRQIIASKAPPGKSSVANYIRDCRDSLEKIRDEKSQKIPALSRCDDPRLSLDNPRNHYIESSEILFSSDRKSFKINAHRLERNSYFPIFTDKDFWLTFDGNVIKEGKSTNF